MGISLLPPTKPEGLHCSSQVYSPKVAQRDLPDQLRRKGEGTTLPTVQKLTSPAKLSLSTLLALANRMPTFPASASRMIHEDQCRTWLIFRPPRPKLFISRPRMPTASLAYVPYPGPFDARLQDPAAVARQRWRPVVVSLVSVAAAAASFAGQEGFLLLVVVAVGRSCLLHSHQAISPAWLLHLLLVLDVKSVIERGKGKRGGLGPRPYGTSSTTTKSWTFLSGP